MDRNPMKQALRERIDKAEARAREAEEQLAANPFKMEPEEIAMWLGGGALPGSVKFEQARAAMDWHTARIQAKQATEPRVHWAIKVGAVAGLIGSVATLIGPFHLVGLI
jgi:hypothetical protein